MVESGKCICEKADKTFLHFLGIYLHQSTKAWWAADAHLLACAQLKACKLITPQLCPFFTTLLFSVNISLTKSLPREKKMKEPRIRLCYFKSFL